jgi:2-amino-4-hydroxy-6-hydroxymethyldihydropteridine diphosphokinase
MVSVFVGLGSNLGRRAENLRWAISELKAKGFELIHSSRIYETKPAGFRYQPKFLNMVIEAQTDLEPLECLKTLKTIESRLGRRRWFKNGPRSIDLDLLFYDQAVVNTGELTIPHPRLHRRPFVLFPLLEIAPNLRHPRLGVSIAEMVKELSSNGLKVWKEALTT